MASPSAEQGASTPKILEVIQPKAGACDPARPGHKQATVGWHGHFFMARGERRRYVLAEEENSCCQLSGQCPLGMNGLFLGGSCRVAEVSQALSDSRFPSVSMP